MITSAVPQRILLFQDNTQNLHLDGLQDSSGAFLNSASISATLLDSNRNEVPGCVAVDLTYVSDSNGDYSGQVSSAFSPTVGTEYTLIIEGDQAGAHLHIELPAEVKVRTR